jgi:hypothetical protein
LDFQAARLPGLEAKILLGFGVQRKLRVVSLPTTWSRACGIDAANLRGHLDLMMPGFNRFDHSFPPIDLDSGSGSAAAVRRLTAGCGRIVVLPWPEESTKDRVGAMGCFPQWSRHESKRSPGGGLTLARQNYLSGIRFIQRPIPPGEQTPPIRLKFCRAK